MDALETHVRRHQRLLTVPEYLKMAEAGLFEVKVADLLSALKPLRA